MKKHVLMFDICYRNRWSNPPESNRNGRFGDSRPSDEVPRVVQKLPLLDVGIPSLTRGELGVILSAGGANEPHAAIASPGDVLGSQVDVDLHPPPVEGERSRVPLGHLSIR